MMSLGELLFTGLLVPVLIGWSALFSAIETGLFSLQSYHLERMRSQKGEFAEALVKLMENPRRVLSAILLGDALVNLPLIILCLRLLGDGLRWHVPFWGAVLIIFGVVVFVCDLVPKLVALADPMRVSAVGVRVMNALLPVLDPPTRVLQRVSDRLADAVTPRSMKPRQMLSDEELSTLLDLSAEEGALHESESEMIQDIIKLGDKTAKDCMTPRVDSFALPDDLTNEEALERIRQRRYRRVPVYGATPDDILGVLDAQAFLLDPSVHYTERLVPPSFVSETMRAMDLLRSFLNHPQGMAIVVDEYGGTEGIVTLADIVEEIISDAVPTAERALYIEALGEGRLLANGNARLDDIHEWVGVRIEEEGIDTIGGLIFNRMGALPKPGARFEIEGLRVTVRRTSRKRIEEVLIEYEENAIKEEPKE